MKLICTFFLLCLCSLSWGRGTYQSPEAFLAQAFAQQVPKPNLIWLSGETRKVATEILTHKPKGLRTRYWANDEKSVWILEEIGKVKPITVGFVIENSAIVHMKVLIFRESRGSEVRHDFFIRQYDNAKLTVENKLDRHIDGITGATLSVRALTRLSRLALYLNKKRLYKGAP